ncbi:MAG: MBL fold metallo-hydrolase [Chitinispirillaceae bacterium]|nr:MBL fold metallo-hydrolase [Chitinispirillaceae bacterium]
MIKELAVTILIDNRSEDPRFLAEHGLSLCIQADDRRILFDAGQSDTFFYNAEKLNIELRSIDTLVLSHGHYDHTGGVGRMLEINPALEVYCHPGVFILRYSRRPDGSMKPIGLSKATADALHRCVDTIHWISRPIWLTEDIGITGPIPRRTVFEDTGGAFFLDPEAERPDPVEDDCAMWFITGRGVTVITGCCHSGLVNTIEQVRSITGALPGIAIIGGFHLLHASMERIEATCDYLHSAGVGKIVPCHCTGEAAVECMEQRFGGDMVERGKAGAIVGCRE